MFIDYFIHLYDRVVDRSTPVNRVVSIMALVIGSGYIFYSHNGPIIFKDADNCQSSSRSLALCQFAESAANQYMKGKLETFSSVGACQATYHNSDCTNNMQSWNNPKIQPEMAGFSFTEKPPAPDDHSWGRTKKGKYPAYYVRGYYRSEDFKSYRAPDSDESFRIQDKRHHLGHRRKNIIPFH